MEIGQRDSGAAAWRGGRHLQWEGFLTPFTKRSLKQLIGLPDEYSRTSGGCGALANGRLTHGRRDNSSSL